MTGPRSARDKEREVAAAWGDYYRAGMSSEEAQAFKAGFAAAGKHPEPEWEYATRKSVTDGWERGDRYGEHEYIDPRSISDSINDDRSTTLPNRDLTRAVRRVKAGPWVPVGEREN